MNNLANALGAQGRYAEAETLHRQTLEIQRSVLGAEHPHVAESLNGLAAVLEKSQQWTEAESLCRQARAIFAARLPEEHPNRRANTNLLGRILVGLGRFAEAEPLLIESYEALRNDAGLRRADRKAIVDCLIRLYESWDAAEPDKGHAETATQWRAKFEEISKS
jgi:tetratricopeptide (TPR) repeat protein